MAQFIPMSSGIEVNGQTILATIEGLGVLKDRGMAILRENGIEDPQADQWYPQKAWLDSFKALLETVGEMTLYRIGKKIPEAAEFPPHIDDIYKALSSIDVAYHMNHKKDGQVMFNPENGSMLEGIGHYGYEQINDREVRMVCNNPYPSDFDRGIIESMAQQFKPDGVDFVTVEYVDSQPSRKKGADSCTYKVTW